MRVACPTTGKCSRRLFRGWECQKNGVSRARGDWKLGGACEEPTLGSRMRWLWFVTLTLAFTFACWNPPPSRKKKFNSQYSFMPFLWLSLFYMALGSLKRGASLILCSSRWFVSSRLLVTAPGDRKKKKACQYRGVGFELLCTPFWSRHRWLV